MAIYSWFSHKKMVIFHSYVSLPEGKSPEAHELLMKWKEIHGTPILRLKFPLRKHQPCAAMMRSSGCFAIFPGWWGTLTKWWSIICTVVPFSYVCWFITPTNHVNEYIILYYTIIYIYICICICMYGIPYYTLYIHINTLIQCIIWYTIHTYIYIYTYIYIHIYIYYIV